MRPKIFVPITLALIALGSVLATGPTVASQAVGMLLQARPDAAVGATSRSVIRIYGLEQSLTFAQLVSRAEIVAVGTLVSDTVVPFATNDAIPQSDRDPRLDAKSAYHDAAFTVRELVKGTAPTTLSVRWLASTPQLLVAQQGLPELTVGEQYVLLLQKGTLMFTGGYIVVSGHGAGVVRGDSATFGKYGPISLAQVRALARR